MKSGLYAAAVVAALAVGTTAADAATVYTLTLNGCSSSCGAGPYGTVTVSPDATDLTSLDITISLENGATFHDNPDKNHHALAFDLVGTPAVTLKNLTLPAGDDAFKTDFSLTGPGTQKASPFGNFDYALNIKKDHNFPTNISTISFELFNPTNTPLTFGFTTYLGSLQVYFATDVISNGNTGNVGALAGVVTTEGGGSPTPEPATWIAMIAGFGLLGTLLRRQIFAPHAAG